MRRSGAETLRANLLRRSFIFLLRAAWVLVGSSSGNLIGQTCLNSARRLREPSHLSIRPYTTPSHDASLSSIRQAFVSEDASRRLFGSPMLDFTPADPDTHRTTSYNNGNALRPNAATCTADHPTTSLTAIRTVHSDRRQGEFGSKIYCPHG